jgi:hypothetical protein
LIGLTDGPVYKAMVKTPARQTPATLAMPKALLSFTLSILVIN